MMSLDEVYNGAILPAYDILPARMRAIEATCLLLAIGLQESRFKYRAQVIRGNPYVKGPARGFWQFELGGGVRGVMKHDASEEWAHVLCLTCGVEWDERAIHAALETDDVLAAGFARLLLLTDPRPLPALDCDHETAWDYYVSNWRPGKPHRETWDEFHAAARIAVRG